MNNKPTNRYDAIHHALETLGPEVTLGDVQSVETRLGFRIFVTRTERSVSYGRLPGHPDMYRMIGFEPGEHRPTAREALAEARYHLARTTARGA